MFVGVADVVDDDVDVVVVSSDVICVDAVEVEVVIDAVSVAVACCVLMLSSMLLI